MSGPDLSVAQFERALSLAARAHSGQTDLAGQPYILHVLRVTLGVETLQQRTVALLHDVVEDTEWSLDDLRRDGFSADVLEAVGLLTHSPEEDYLAYVLRLSQNQTARAVKIADLKDNLQPSRIVNPTGVDLRRSERYRMALAMLEK